MENEEGRNKKEKVEKKKSEVETYGGCRMEGGGNVMQLFSFCQNSVAASCSANFDKQ